MTDQQQITGAQVVISIRTDKLLTDEELDRAQAAAQVALTGITDPEAPPVTLVNYYPVRQA